METAPIDYSAVEQLRQERLDWRFKGMPPALSELTIAAAAAARPTLFDSGFVGPLMVLDGPALDHNLRAMADWCAASGVVLAPHGKTTMAPQLFARQLDLGSWAITAANLSQVRTYRAFGVRRVFLANQLVDPAGLAWLAGELADPGFEFLCWADSVAGVELMHAALAKAGAARPVDVLVELGGPAGRTGARDLDTARAVADAIAASPHLRLAGVGGYEGALAHDSGAESLSIVDAYLKRLVELATGLFEAGLFAEVEQVVVSAGGSAYFDQVAAAITREWPSGMTVLPVLRSGAYLTHDDGYYRGISPLGQRPRTTGTPFRPALHAWAQVTSRPEPDLALLTAGKRDLSYDLDLPEPQLIRHAGQIRPLTGSTVSAMNDQHTFLRLGPDDRAEVGDWVRLGLSHPCTVFDKWQLLPVVDADGETVVDFIRTHF